MPKNTRQKQYKRAEDYTELMADLSQQYSADVIELIDSYIHSPLLVQRPQKPEDIARRDFGTIKMLLQDAYEQQAKCKF